MSEPYLSDLRRSEGSSEQEELGADRRRRNKQRKNKKKTKERSYFPSSLDPGSPDSDLKDFFFKIMFGFIKLRSKIV